MNKLKLLREEKNLLQEELGKVIGVSGRAIGNYEKGTRDMSTEIVIKLANFFNVSTDYLLGKSNERNPKYDINSELIKIGLSLKDYNPPTAEQKKQIEDFAKFVLKDNKKRTQ